MNNCDRKRKRGENVKLYTYIGETSRSAKERGEDMLKIWSHMLKHIGTHSINSKIEYSRTIIPSIKVKMGHKTEEEGLDIQRGKSAIEKMKILRKVTKKVYKLC